MIERIVRDMHLAIFSEEVSVGIDDDRGVVIKAGAALFEERGDDDNAELFRELAQSVARFAGNGFRQSEV